MGVDCYAYLPDRVKVRDVAEVLGALAGLPMQRMELPSSRENEPPGWAAHNPAVKIRVCEDCPHLVTLEFTEPSGQGRMIYYHFEARAPEGSCRMVSCKSRARNIAYAVGLVDFFGGMVDFNDCDDTRADYGALSPRDIDATNGAPWYELQERKMAIKPVTLEQIAKYRAKAAYRD